MRRTISASATALAIIVATAGLAGSTLASGGVSVSSTVPWTLSGIYLTQGATYNVLAQGSVQTAKVPYYHVPGVSKSQSGPAGQPNQPCLASYENPINGECALVGANFGTLVGVVINGDTGQQVAPPFAIGAGPSFVAPAEGWLFLAVNDLNLTYYDNNGAFQVTITGP